VLLADDLIEGLRAVAAVEGRLAGHRAESTGVSNASRSRNRVCQTDPVSTEDIIDHGQRIAALERKVSELYKHLGQAETGFGGGVTFASDEPASVTAEQDPRLIELIQTGKKIEAIKLYRELTRAGLAEAKDAVERLEATYRPIG
jgi:ribosomal protein L7/L12